MDDDLNTALAIGVLHELARDLNRHLTQKEEFTADQLVLLREGGRLLARFLKLLGITPEQANGSFPGLEEELLEIILAVREQARQNKDWEQADWIRDSLQELGIQIIDTPDGPKWELD
ncbi:MAG: DALR domain-containing protein, partial [Halanaerobium sp.]|nr:DALR domain-containing protein [Halanaerobium sp.]